MGLAEDLTALADLFERGLIDRHHFEEAKQRLLARPAETSPTAESPMATATAAGPPSTGEGPEVALDESPSKLPRLLAVAGGLGVAIAAVVLALNLSSDQGDGPEVATPPPPQSVDVTEIVCRERASYLPPGTQLTSLEMQHLDDGSLQATAIFDGDLPEEAAQLRGGDLRVSVTFVFDQDGVVPPYQVMVSTLFGSWSAQAGRPGGGFIDSGGISTTIFRDAVQITLDPTPFVELDASDHISLSATTLVSVYVEERQRLGFDVLGEQSCGGNT